jgi:hypothetical protein
MSTIQLNTQNERCSSFVYAKHGRIYGDFENTFRTSALDWALFGFEIGSDVGGGREMTFQIAASSASFNFEIDPSESSAIRQCSD